MDFEWPIPHGYHERPVWTGKGFAIAGQNISILKYTEDSSGWDDSLTTFHENEASHGNHYMDKASRRHALQQIKGEIGKQRFVILEVGSSSGYFLRNIKLAAPTAFIIGSDCISGPLERLAVNMPDMPLIQFDLTKCPLPDRSVDVIVLLNVLEHIEDDQKALKQLYRILKPGGIAVIEVPANPVLYDFYDELLRHYRRYDLKTLLFISEKVGFRIKYKSHLGFFIYPLFKFVKLRNKLKKNETVTEKQLNVKKMIGFGGSIANQLLYVLMLSELTLGTVIRYPFGVRCLLTLEK